MGQQRKTWTIEQKLTVILSVLGEEESVARLARQHGVSEQHMYRWQAPCLEGGRQALGGVKAPRTDQHLRREHEQLKQLLGEKTLALEILKKLSSLCACPRWPRSTSCFRRRSRAEALCAWWIDPTGADEMTCGWPRLVNSAREVSRLFGKRGNGPRERIPPMGTGGSTMYSGDGTYGSAGNGCGGCWRREVSRMSDAQRNAGPRQAAARWQSSLRAGGCTSMRHASHALTASPGCMWSRRSPHACVWRPALAGASAKSAPLTRSEKGLISCNHVG
jgi:transposase-like protein